MDDASQVTSHSFGTGQVDMIIEYDDGGRQILSVPVLELLLKRNGKGGNPYKR